jgi:HEAT repeat protein
MQGPRFRLRTRALLAVVACIALGCWGWVAYLSPGHRWHRMILSDDDSPHRWDAAAKAIKGEFPGVDRAEAIAALASALGDPSPRVRETAVYTLGTLRGPEARSIARSLAMTLGDASTVVRLRAVESLGSMAESDQEIRPVVIPALIGVLRDRTPDVRIEAGYWLTLMDRGESAIHVLEDAMFDGKDHQGRAALALGLLGSGEAPAVEALKLAADGSSDPRIREAATLALERLAEMPPR